MNYLIHYDNVYKRMSVHQKIYLIFKGIIDFVGAFVGILLFAVLFYWWIFIVNFFVTKGHPIYIQKRYGKHKKVFGLIKFRSMRFDAPELPPSEWGDEQRIKYETKFGIFLRKTSLDETLQLFNILVGQMAFIGPRPGAAVGEEELVKLRELYTPSVFEVRPGLGGLAQVKSNRAHDPVIKAKYDYEYVCNLSFWLDIKIFVFTIFGLFGKGKGK